MKKGKLLTLLPLMLLPFAMTGCNGNKKTIGICQFVKFEALDRASEGFMDAVKKGLGEKNVTFDLQIASEDPAICSTICNTFVSKNVDLIMANATPAVQAAYNSTKSIPILGTSVTEYGVALSIKDFNGTVGGNVSGTSDIAPLEEQAAMIKELVPAAQNVGLLYCSAEPNSVYQVDRVEAALKKDGLTTKRITFSETNELQGTLTANVAGLDALYIPTDNTCAKNTSIIDTVCRDNKLPVICGEEGMCKGCGIATLSIDYYALGVKTGEMAVEILKDGKDISKMPIAYDENPSKKFNKELCDLLNITVPDGYVQIA